MGEIAINPQHNVFKKYRTVAYLNSYFFTPPAITYNTFIGGVSGTISTAALLATKLGISVGAISNFTVVGSDIKCKITGSYTIPSNAFLMSTAITYYIDSDSLITNLGNSAFESAVNFTRGIFNGIITLTGGNVFRNESGGLVNLHIEMKSLTTITANPFYGSNKFIITFYAPNLVTIGENVLYNGVFYSVLKTQLFYLNPFLSTCNSGGVEGDVAYTIGLGTSVRYVSNFTSPNSITTLASGTIYNTAIQLNFTPPSSTNAIDYYECYADGVYKNKITASGQYITGLTPSTAYNVTVVAVDIFYNKSVVSNSLNVTTTSANATASETTAFASRVSADSGVLIDQTYINNEFIKIITQSLESYLLAWHNYKSGLKKDGGNLVEKMYSFSGANTDVIQTTAANKPTYTATGITFDLTDTLDKTLSPTINNKTFSVMWRVKATPGNYYPFTYLGSWDSFQMHSASGGVIYAGITVANRFVLGAGSFLTNTDATYTFTYNSTTKIAKIYRGTTLLGSKTMVDPINFTSIRFDAQNGTFYDYKLFSKDLTLTEITNLL